jgi:branched-chain amino acid transport system substrate-binding protein
MPSARPVPPSSPAFERAAGALLLVPTLLLSACEGPSQARSDAELRIGVLPILSGVRAPNSGAPMLEGARLAAQEVNAAGGLWLDGRRYRVVLVSEDTRDTEEGAVSVARELINRAQVVALVGPQVSTQAIAVAALAENARIPMVTPGATHPLITRGKRYVFRVSPPDDVQGAEMARFAYTGLAARRAAVLYDVANPYSQGLAETFREAFAGLGGQVVAFETYTTDAARDFAPQIERILAGAPDLLVLPTYPAEAVLQMRQARAAGFRGAFLGSDGWEASPPLQAEPAAQGAYFTHTWHADGLGPATVAFRQRYRRAYGREPVATAAATYDAVGLLLQAARAQGSADAEAIRQGLEGIRSYPGVAGTLSFGAGGDPIKAMVILRIQGGREVLHRRLDPVPRPAAAAPH